MTILKGVQQLILAAYLYCVYMIYLFIMVLLYTTSSWVVYITVIAVLGYDILLTRGHIISTGRIVWLGIFTRSFIEKQPRSCSITAILSSRRMRPSLCIMGKWGEGRVIS